MPPKDANRLVFYLSRAARELRAASEDLAVALFYAQAFLVQDQEEPEPSEEQSDGPVGFGPAVAAAAVAPPPAVALPLLMVPGGVAISAPTREVDDERPPARSRSPRRLMAGSGLRPRGD